ncbi:hypothetical protein LSCM4_02857 [Leishmania orientalis]|uniref:Uncharacterized protein n=1 Tax=Leishmania orientalis TaxID=2249476 RepID=A0A836GUL8_9TRYP|nr:hypothetical protein LSCM4_02857 [Leishmania orientalis]
MSCARRSRSRNGKPAKGDTYSRADEALWDDAYLLKLFNEQLDNADAVKDTREETPNNEDSVLSTATEITDGKEEAAGDSATSSSSDTSERGAREKEAPRSAESALVRRSFPTLNGLPDDIEALVQSFYTAGFEAGRFVGRSETSKKGCRKRHR